MPEKNEENLRRHYEAEKGPIPWKELELYFAHGSAVYVEESLDMVEVAVQMALDNRSRFQGWMDDQKIRVVPDDLAREWFDNKATVMAVVVSPWVLVQKLN